jgi:hypothetical protein
MKNFKRQIIIALTAAILFVAGTAQAASWYSGYYTIEKILVHNTSLEVTLQGDSGCNRTFRLPNSSSNYDVKASALLSAYYAGHEIGVYYSGTLSSCSTELQRFKVRR